MLKPLQYRPIGGINGEDSEDMLGDTEVRTAANFLFERKQAILRPGAVRIPITNFTGQQDFGKSIRLDVNPVTVLISSNGKLYSLTSVGSCAEITGAGTTLGSPLFHGAEAVNGIIVIANNSGGMLRWDTTGTAYTIMAPATSNYRYVTSHLFRAIGAYKLDGLAGDARRIGWTQSGDETLWTAGDSGSSNLVDAPDDITGLGVLHNVLVVVRREGFHLGLITGSSQPVYDFQTFGRGANGCQYPSTLATVDNKMIYCSQEDVYVFDLQNSTPIGGKIRDELFGYLQMGIGYRGYYSKGVGVVPRYRYNLVPTSNTATYPHFIYDLKEDSWSRHTYDFPVRGGFYVILTQAQEGITVFAAEKIAYWDSSQPCEAAAYLVGRTLTIEDESNDYIVRSILLSHRNFGKYAIQMGIRSSLNTDTDGNTDIQSIGNTAADQKLMRTWFRNTLSGQKFEPRIDIPAGLRFATTGMILKYSESGEYKGDPGQ